MSVFSNNVYFFEAPVGVSERKVVISGSWITSSENNLHMDPTYMFHYRLHTWKQQFESKTSAMCVDLSIREKDQVFIVLKMRDNAFESCLQNDDFLEHINNILSLHAHKIWAFKNAFDLAGTTR